MHSIPLWEYTTLWILIIDSRLFHFETILSRVTKNMRFDDHTFLSGMHKILGAQAVFCSAFVEIKYHFNMLSLPIFLWTYDFCSCWVLYLLGKLTLFMAGLKSIIHKDDYPKNYWVDEFWSCHWILIITVMTTSYLTFSRILPFSVIVCRAFSSDSSLSPTPHVSYLAIFSQWHWNQLPTDALTMVWWSTPDNLRHFYKSYAY